MFGPSLYVLYSGICLISFCMALFDSPRIQAQTVAISDSASIHQLYHGLAIRFIENNGQYPEGILFYAPIHDGYILFMRDRIMLQRFELFEKEAEERTNQSPPRSLMSDLRFGEKVCSLQRDSRIVTRLLASPDTLTWGGLTSSGLTK
jgi:hypothetical protein